MSVDDTDDSITHDVDKTTTIKYNGRTLFKYDAETHILAINGATEFMLDIGSIPVDLCFPVPGKEKEHYCFNQVKQVIKLEESGGLIKRFTRFIRRG